MAQEKAQTSMEHETRTGRFSQKQGLFAAIGAYGLWGIFPLYWKLLSSVLPLQILAHRILWAAVFCLMLLLARKEMSSLGVALKDPRKRVLVGAAGLLVTVNWGMYIYAVNSGHVLETALGYYINPLLSVALGAMLFREHIDRWTRIAVGIALVGIVAAGILYGQVPWISLILAITFALYGAVKKGLGLAPITSLALETFSVAPLAFAFLAVMHAQGAGSFGNAGLRVTALLALSGVVTAVPLLLFGVAAISISLQLIGFIQYLTPTSQLLLGLFLYKEKPNAAVVAAFVAVLVAVVIFAVTRFKKGEPA
ncbi:Protein RarD [uncultured spirochete]|jgi:chloramphenicol-sensitive protein RarD|uniref:Protein RarD n=1 Tax=uncultured spirochete TaxID=156406 RepID=A0A3P3XK10_9SPIR|nr:Protein RarD [uncultured spirochete]